MNNVVMKKEIWLMIVVTLIIAVGHALQKIAAARYSFSIEGLLLNWPLIGGLALMGVAAVVMTMAFQHGELSTLFPLVALSYVWTALIAVFFFNEVFPITAFFGTLFIIAGVVLIGRGVTQ